MAVKERKNCILLGKRGWSIPVPLKLIVTHILQKAFSNRLKKIILPLVQRILSNHHIDLSDFSYAASILLFEWMSLSKNEKFN